jgi:hypothetical protein
MLSGIFHEHKSSAPTLGYPERQPPVMIPRSQILFGNAFNDALRHTTRVQRRAL